MGSCKVAFRVIRGELRDGVGWLEQVNADKGTKRKRYHSQFLESSSAAGERKGEGDMGSWGSFHDTPRPRTQPCCVCLYVLRIAPCLLQEK